MPFSHGALRRWMFVFALLGLLMPLTPNARAQLPTVVSVTLTGPSSVVQGSEATFTGMVSAVTDIGVPNQHVTILVDGEQAASATTDATGTYQATVTLSDLGERTLEAVVHAGTPLQARSVPHAVTVATILAPPVDPTVTTTVADSTRFLYEGDDAPQQGVSSGTIEPQRAAVVRGRVLDVQGEPLAGVDVRILDHEEFGWTTSRSDGWFDLAVNGGGLLTLAYAKDGHLPAQRQVEVPWQDYVSVDDVILVTLDEEVTAVEAGAEELQVARGSEVTDDDGTRRATLLFQRGTTAEMTLPDGSVQPLDTLHVRATEFTVGERGPEAMPGELPSSSGYTYAVELSVDEAIAADATEVRFSQPVAFYLENFIDFPVGGAVPVGWYDREEARWVPSDNGRVVAVVAEADGRAQLDVDGDGAADSGEELAALGVTDDELAQVAALYEPGASLWRVPIDHFTPWDCNWPYGPPDDAIDPRQPRPKKKNSTDDDCYSFGSVIGCQNQTLGEAVSIKGTAFALHYTSERTSGYTSPYTLEISLTGGWVPPSMRRVHLDITVAGKVIRSVFPPAANLSHTFVWDGKDAYGRRVQGQQRALVRLGYAYGAVYRTPEEMTQSFARFGGAVIESGRGASEMIMWQQWSERVGGWTMAVAGLGGWSLDAHHAYDPTGRMLLLGDGTRRSADAVASSVLDTVAGGTTRIESSGDGGPARDAGLAWPHHIVSAADGSMYFTEIASDRVRRIAPDGTITTVAGNGTRGHSGDGGPATEAQLSGPRGLVVADDGTIYIADSWNNAVRKVTPDGIITTIAGGHGYGGLGDGGPAVAAQLRQPHDVAVTADGVVYIADSGSNRIRRIGVDGIITTIAGPPGECSPGWWADCPAGYAGDGGPARNARFRTPTGLAVGPDGALFIADFWNFRIRRIGVDGIISTVVGNGTGGYSGDGGPATEAQLNHPVDVSVTPDGRLFISDSSNFRVRMVRPDGTIVTIAGNGQRCTAGWYDTHDCAEGTAATAARLSSPQGVAPAPDGTVYIADLLANRIARVRTAMPGFSLADIVVPSKDGREVYHFDASGRHLRTLEALTGAVLLTFAYDGGVLARVTDGDGRTTAIERDRADRPVAVVAPDGRRTQLETDAHGNLTKMMNPAGEPIALTYHERALLASFTDPRGATSTFDYDAQGLLVKDTGPEQNVTTITRVDTATSTTVELRDATGGVTSYHSERLPSGDRKLSSTDAAGGKTSVLSRQDGVQVATTPDGTTTTVTHGPDPRWGMAAPVVTRVEEKTPAGVTRVATARRSVTLADRDDPFTLLTLQDVVTVAPGSAVTAYDAATRTLTSQTASNRKTTVTLDERGRPVRIAPPGVAATVRTYDAAGDLVAEERGGEVVRYAYDAAGRLVERTGGDGSKTTFTWDAADRLTSRTTPDGATYRFGYDANGNRTSLVMPSGDVHTLDYTATNQRAAYAPPGNAAYTRTYDKALDLVERGLPTGRAIAVDRDEAGRAVAEHYDEAAAAFTYAAGRLDASAMAWSGGGFPDSTTTWTRDGALLTAADTAGAAAGEFRYAYDNRWWLKSFELRSGTDVVTRAVARDADGLLTQIGPVVVERNGPGGRPSVLRDDHQHVALAYDAFGRLAARTQTVAGTQRYAATLTHDTAGRIASKEERKAGVTTAFAYAYDAAGRLVEVRRDGTVAEAYAYDANGNRTSFARDGGPAVTGTYDGQDRLTQVGVVGYQFDADGFLRRRGADVFRYSARGELLEAVVAGQQVTYGYDALGRRTSRTVNGATTGYLYGNPADPFQVSAVRETDGTLSLLTYDEAGLLLAVERAGVRYAVATDEVGTPQVVTAPDGTVVEVLDHDAFGVLRTDSNATFSLPLGYAGGLADPVTGLVRFGFRDYDPEAGRWTARDPIFFDGGQANLYAYVASNPVGFRDPTGLWCIGGSVYTGIGGGIQICHNDDGTSFCSEIGFGLGGSLDINGDGPADTGDTILAEAEAGCGPVSGTVGISLDDKGCLRGKSPEGKLGPATYNDESGLGGKLGGDFGAFFKSPKCGVEAKLAGKSCVRYG